MTGEAPDLQVGSPGQFDVLVDGEVIATRGGGFFARFFGGGWPEPKAVAQLVKYTLERGGTGFEADAGSERAKPVRG